MVLHGGGGTGDDLLRRAVELGILKVTLITDLSNAGIAAIVKYL
jgi:fructose-bisphosphate aldolase class II